MRRTGCRATTYTAAALERCRISSTPTFCYIRSAESPRTPSNESEPSRCLVKTMVRCQFRCSRGPCPGDAAHAASSADARDRRWACFWVDAVQGPGDHALDPDRRAENTAAHGFSYWDSAIIAAARAL